MRMEVGKTDKTAAVVQDDAIDESKSYNQGF